MFLKKRSQLKKGDLVFFTSKHHTKINHIGIYLGHGKFIHASRFHHRIVISPLKEYKKYFKWGTRLKIIWEQENSNLYMRIKNAIKL